MRSSIVRATLAVAAASCATVSAPLYAQTQGTNWSVTGERGTYRVIERPDVSCTIQMVSPTSGFYINRSSAGASRMIMSNDTTWFAAGETRNLNLTVMTETGDKVISVPFRLRPKRGSNGPQSYESTAPGDFHRQLLGGYSLAAREKDGGQYFYLSIDNLEITQAVEKYEACLARL